MKVWNILWAAFWRGHFFVMLQKLWLRFNDSQSSISPENNIAWLNENESSLCEFCSELNEDLWAAIQIDVNRIHVNAKKSLDGIPFDLGGGGAYPLLYFIIMFRRPSVVVETGVASGFSTYSILEALNKNSYGHLYSSDLPYFRLPNPSQYIGIVVPDHLKDRWSLYTKGDNINLNVIKRCISNIDVFHYDSDKTYKGRSEAFKILGKLLTSKTWIIVDDIQDNGFFYDLLLTNEYKNWRVFSFEGKWVGLIIPES